MVLLVVMVDGDESNSCGTFVMCLVGLIWLLTCAVFICMDDRATTKMSQYDQNFIKQG